VLPLRGKILNVEKARIDKVLQNTEIQALITALGPACATSSTSERLRYHKIILMTDADVDGAHIRTLILTLLFREMQELIEAGYVYIAKPPLYKLKQGQQERYIEKDSELEEILLGDKLERFEFDQPAPVQADRDPLAALQPLLKQYEGWASRCARPRHESSPSSRSPRSRRAGHDSTGARRLSAATPEASRTPELARRERRACVKAVEPRPTSRARTACAVVFERTSTASRARARELVKWRPPRSRGLARATRRCPFEELRARVMRSREGRPPAALQGARAR
jgi:hypothetical protein